MKPKLIVASALLFGLSIPASYAHHSFASYDMSKTMVIKGVVTKFEWTNPHAWVHVEVTNAKGEKEAWDIETGAPNLMVRSGWKQKDLKAGDVVTVGFSPRRDETRGGALQYVILPDGTHRGSAIPADGNYPSADAASTSGANAK